MYQRVRLIVNPKSHFIFSKNVLFVIYNYVCGDICMYVCVRVCMYVFR